MRHVRPPPVCQPPWIAPPCPGTCCAAAGRSLRATGYTLFFLMLFLPAAYQPLKGVLLGLTLVGILIAAAVTGRFPLAPAIALGALGYSALGLAYVIRGLMGGAPGALAMFNVYVMWPLVYTLLVVGASFPGVLRGLTRVMVYAGLAISLYSIIYVLREAGFWPSALYYAFDQGQAIGFYGTHVEFGLYSTTTLLFLVPYLVGALFVFPKGARARQSAHVVADHGPQLHDRAVEREACAVAAGPGGAGACPAVSRLAVGERQARKPAVGSTGVVGGARPGPPPDRHHDRDRRNGAGRLRRHGGQRLPLQLRRGRDVAPRSVLWRSSTGGCSSRSSDPGMARPCAV